jgi:UDP-glucuronate 4-epimerase
MKVFLTGAAGFIGMHVARRLLARGDEVLGIDNLNDYYDPQLKHDRLAQLRPFPGFRFVQADVADPASMDSLFAAEKPTHVVHLAAQAGVRYSLQNPSAYVQSNLVGFGHVLEACRQHGVQHLVYASSSSVYGANREMPFSVADNVDHPVSLYAASKKANELMAHAYSHLFDLPTTGLRYFTVYGPWGRPDMAPWLFTRAIEENRPIDVFNHGKMRRDFTYIDDIAEGTVRVLDRTPERAPRLTDDNLKPGSSDAPYRVYNIGNHQPVALMEFIGLLEQQLGRMAVKNFKAMQPGDVQDTYADTLALRQDLGFEARTPLAEGLAQWVAWYRGYTRQGHVSSGG